ncbi:hypothetical protein K469DRAFT_768181, partial [Zopfia rhizophila CBS 207.26]
PPEKDPFEHLETPQRSAVLAVLYFCDKEDLYCPLNKIAEIFNIHESTASDILRSKRAQRLHNSDGPDTRGRPRQLTNSDANAIASYIDECLFEEKGDHWPELVYKARVVPADGMENYTHQCIL